MENTVVNEVKDCFIKNDGKIMTIGFQTDKAKHIFGQQSDELKMHASGKNIILLELEASSKNETNVMAFFVSHSLTFERL
jgi:hypothetical protein